jgi:hypothetical protein
MKGKITKQAIDALAPGKIISDSEIVGFRVRRLPSLRVCFAFHYSRGDGRRSYMSLGLLGNITVHQARQLALKYAGQVVDGRDPATDKKSAPLRDLEQRTANKALEFLKRGIEPACYLYRHFHPNGDLLYVGISLTSLKRQDRHLKTADWRNTIHRIVIEPFATREEALDAEQFAIRTEFPRFNATHNRRRRLDQELAYLHATNGTTLAPG